MKRNLAAALTLLFASQLAEAAGWTSELTVSSAFTEGTSDFVVIYTSDAGVYTTGCTAKAWHFYADSEARRGPRMEHDPHCSRYGPENKALVQRDVRHVGLPLGDFSHARQVGERS